MNILVWPSLIPSKMKALSVLLKETPNPLGAEMEVWADALKVQLEDVSRWVKMQNANSKKTVSRLQETPSKQDSLLHQRLCKICLRTRKTNWMTLILTFRLLKQPHPRNLRTAGHSHIHQVSSNLHLSRPSLLLSLLQEDLFQPRSPSGLRSLLSLQQSFRLFMHHRLYH